MSNIAADSLGKFCLVQATAIGANGDAISMVGWSFVGFSASLVAFGLLASTHAVVCNFARLLKLGSHFPHRSQTMHSEVDRIRILHTVRLLLVSSVISMLNELFLLFGYGKLVPIFRPGLLFGSGAEDAFFRPVQEPVHLLAMSLLRCNTL